MARVLDWRGSADQRGLVRQALEILRRGGSVCFPTETVYMGAASAHSPEAIVRLARFAERPLSVAVRNTAEAVDWSPTLSELGRRLTRRCWPGPVELICDYSSASAASSLPEPSRRHVLADDAVRLSSPAHDAIRLALMEMPDPVVLVGANRIDQTEVYSAATAVETLGATVDLILDDGPTRYSQPDTVVRIAGEGWSIVRPGVVSESLLHRQSAFLVVFVCTGNTCRSPLAEASCKRLLAEQLECDPVELAERGFQVISAGLSAIMGDSATAEAVLAARELGVDLSGHRSMPLTRELADKADCIVAMTQGHLLTIAYYHPDALERSILLRADGADVADPIGCEMEVYRSCATEISEQLRPLVSKWIKK